MPFIIVLLAIVLLVLNLGMRPSKANKTKSGKLQIKKRLEKYPVARTYPILYWYAVLNLIAVVASIIRAVLFMHPWAADASAELQARHMQYLSAHTFNTELIVGEIIALVIVLVVMAYLVTSHNTRVVINTLIVLLGLQAFGLVFTPPFSFGWVLGIAQALFTFFVLRSVSKGTR